MYRLAVPVAALVIGAAACQLFTGTGDFEYREGAGGAAASGATTTTGSSSGDTTHASASSSSSGEPTRSCDTCYSAVTDGPAIDALVEIADLDFCEADHRLVHTDVHQCGRLWCGSVCNGVENPFHTLDCILCLSFACADATLRCIETDPVGCVSCPVAAGARLERNSDADLYCPDSKDIYVELLDSCVCGEAMPCQDACTNGEECVAVAKANQCSECVGDDICGEDCTGDELPDPPPFAE